MYQLRNALLLAPRVFPSVKCTGAVALRRCLRLGFFQMERRRGREIGVNSQRAKCKVLCLHQYGHIARHQRAHLPLCLMKKGDLSLHKPWAVAACY